METSERTPLHSKDDNGGRSGETFSTMFGLVCTCISSAIGTGNIWRFPRIAAANSGQKGGLCFLLVWILMLVIWSIPIMVIEFGVGRYTRQAVTRSFQRLLGTRFTWCGFWIVGILFCISAYYTVVAGWCLYYSFYFMVHTLPESYGNSTDIFNAFALESRWSFLTQATFTLLSGAILVKGVRIIERANLFFAPVLLLIVFILAVWAACRPDAGRGLAFLFSPDWESLKNPSLWLEAASQNAFDTNAGNGIFLTYAVYMSREHPAVKLAVVIPVMNNIISLLCGMTIFSTVFSSLTSIDPNVTDAALLKILQTSGPASSGLTFIWMPVLMQTTGAVGRVMVVLFFICLAFAALSSLIANQESIAHMFEDFGVPRVYSVLVTQGSCYLLGIGSVLNLDFLANQDLTWGNALLLSGLMLLILVIVFGSGVFRRVVVNEHGIGDWNLPKLWEYNIKFVAPVLTSVLVCWWIAKSVIADDAPGGYKWYQFGPTTLLGTLLQWLLLFLVSGLVCFLLECLRPKWYSVPKLVLDPDSTGQDNPVESETKDRPEENAEEKTPEMEQSTL